MPSVLQWIACWKQFMDGQNTQDAVYVHVFQSVGYELFELHWLQ